MLVKEYAVAILVSKSNSVVGHIILSEGGTDATIIDPKLVGKAICDTLSQGVILVHNHPSGQLSASAQDVRVTQKIERVCNVFDVRLLDHIILTDGGYYSLRDNELI
ncbi:MAG: JAB domain-containing protein [Bacteroidales bacterium]|nr:JAB domain-containing protein [Bacteroidales bacterium]